MTHKCYNQIAKSYAWRGSKAMTGMGGRLEDTRKQRVLTQAELAEKAGVALITVTRLENSKGDANPRADTVRRLADALGVEPSWLLFGDEGLKAAA